MKHLDLFSGIGGFALAARWMGWETIQFCEIDNFCQKVLKKHWPNVPIHGDIKTFNGESLRGTVDILTGGFPCQPFSSAGKQRGAEDDRFLWYEMFRVAKELEVPIIVGENVTGIINLALDEILASLENEAYETETFIIPACGLGAPHKRDRVWIVAYSKSFGNNRRPKKVFEKNGGQNRECYAKHIKHGGFRITTDTRIKGLPKGRIQSWDEKEFSKSNDSTREFNWDSFPTQSPICRRNDGLPNRVDRIKSLGNAIVPQVAFEIFKAIEATR